MLFSKFNAIIKYGLYLIILLPLAITPFTFFPWHFGKTVIFQIIVEVLVFVYLWRILSFSRSLSPTGIGERESSGHAKWFQRFNFLDWSILAFLAIITVTSLIGVNPVNSFFGNQARANGVFTWLHFGAFYFLLKYYLQNFGRRSFAVPIQHVIPTKEGIQQTPLRRPDSIFQGNDKSIIVISIAVAVLVSLTSIFPQILPFSWLATSGGGIIGNRAFLAFYLILATGFALYLFVNFKNKWRWLFLAVAILFFYTIIDTGNRGALLGIVVGIFFGLAFCLFFIRNKKVRIWSAISLIVLCFLFIAIFLSRQNLFWQKYFPPLSNLASISLSSGTAQTRLMAWQSGWDGFKEKPLLGWGWGNYEIIFNKYYNPQFLKSGFSETVWDKPHNWLLEIGVTAGILGAVSYLAILFFAGFYLWRKKNIILFATLAAYFVAGLFLFETTNSLILWFLILAIVSALHKRETESCQREETNISRRFSKISNIQYPISFLLFFVLCLSLYYLHYLPLKSSYYMRQAELAQNLNDWLVAVQKTLAIPVSFFSENAISLAEQLTKFEKAGAISKDANIESITLLIAKTLDNESNKYSANLAFPVWAGQAYLVLGEKIDEKYYVEAEKSLSHALEIAPRKQEVLFLLVRLYLLKQDFDKAIEFAQKAVDVAPDIGTSHWFLGLANVASGARAPGLKSIEKAIELGYSLTADQELYVLDLYALEKNYSKLIEEYKRMIESNPENVNWLIKLAAVYAESGDKKAALETTRQAVGLFPPLKAEAEKFIKQYKLLEK